MNVGIKTKLEKDMVSMDSGAKYEPKDKDMLVMRTEQAFFLCKEFDQQSCVKNTATLK